jgi:hypothetical protein
MKPNYALHKPGEPLEDLFVVPVQAEADGSGDIAPGSPNALLVLVLAGTEQDARARAGANLFKHSEWIKVRVGEAARPKVSPDEMEEPLRSAAEYAILNGFAVVVYGPATDA